VNGLLLDLDGVFYVGTSAVPGACEALQWSQRRRFPHLFVTNTTFRPRQAIVEKLRRFGIKLQAAQLLTPAVAAAEWLGKHCRGEVAPFVPAATEPELSAFPCWEPGRGNRVCAVMVGDDIRGDAEGAQRAGLGAILVRTGKLSPTDLNLGILPPGSARFHRGPARMVAGRSRWTRGRGSLALPAMALGSTPPAACLLLAHSRLLQ